MNPIQIASRQLMNASTRLSVSCRRSDASNAAIEPLEVVVTPASVNVVSGPTAMPIRFRTPDSSGHRALRAAR